MLGVFVSIECLANILTLPDGSAACLDGSGNVVAWQVVPPFDISQLDTTQAGQAFAAAFVIVGMCWALGKAVGMILQVIRR
jgi:sugar/nucleoside kinase (ribokinase family)